MRASSSFFFFSHSSSTRKISARGMKTTPVSSATTRSPGLTRTSPIWISPLISTVSSRHLPVAGDLAGPDRVADRTRMPHVAHAAHDDGAALALALAGVRRDAAHIGHPSDAGDHQHVAVFGEVMRLELGHAVDVGF